jgi:hypothetical protein
VGGHPAPVKVGVQLRKADRFTDENNCGADLFAHVGIGQRNRRGREDRGMAQRLLFEVGRRDGFTAEACIEFGDI